jgi:hypothetical protein
VDAQHARHGRDDVAAVADHDRARIEHLVEHFAEAVVVDRRRVRVHLRAVLVPPRALCLTQPLEPRLAVDAHVLHAVGEDPEHGRAVADDAGVGCAVPPEFRRVGVDVHELRVAEAAEAEPEVERRPDYADHVGRLERRAARVLEEQLVFRRQRAATGAVQEDRQLPVLREERELLPRAVPPDPVAGDHRRALGAVEQLGSLHHLARVAERSRRRARRSSLDVVRVGKKHVHR